MPTPTPNASDIGDHEITIHWQDSYFEIAYDIYVNGVFVASVGEDVVTYTLVDLFSGTVYNIKIIAKDGYGGEEVQTFTVQTTDGLGWLAAIYNMLL